jgi:hypothetical protein
LGSDGSFDDKIADNKHVPRRVLSMMLKLEIFERKSAARGAYGFLVSVVAFVLGAVPRFPLALTPLVNGTATIWLGSEGSVSLFSWGHISRGVQEEKFELFENEMGVGVGLRI